MELQEEEILTACALRFDGYAYVEATGFDYDRAIDNYFRSGVWDLEPLEQLATFFMLQRGLCKWNLVYEPQDGKYWRAFRELFLKAYRHEIPERYRQQPYYDEWAVKSKAEVRRCVALVRGVNEGTAYKADDL